MGQGEIPGRQRQGPLISNRSDASKQVVSHHCQRTAEHQSGGVVNIDERGDGLTERGRGVPDQPDRQRVSRSQHLLKVGLVQIGSLGQLAEPAGYRGRRCEGFNAADVATPADHVVVPRNAQVSDVASSTVGAPM